jgi:RNA polymerase sigma-70 factor (ECF subfamily)
MTDEALIAQVKAGDETALGELYRRYNRLVFSLALHMCGNRATAEEITLDVFTRVWRKADSYRPEKAQLSTWLTAMARYRAIDYLRRENARPQLHDAPLEDALFLDGSTPAAARRRPEDTTSRHLRRERVREALAQLPPEQQQVLALAYFQGLSHREMADLLELPLGTVKTRLRLALKKLRFDLREETPAG